MNNRWLSRIELKSLLFLGHVINSKYKYFGCLVGITSIQNTFDKNGSSNRKL
jgi:hypothetical protein